MMKQITKIAVLCGLVLLLLGLCACGTQTEGKMNITSFERMTLSITGMRAYTEEYEIVKSENGVTLSRYEGSWRYNDSQNREDCLVARLEGDEALYAQILTKLNDFKIAKWDGFQKSDKYMLDGYMFLFEASVNGGSRIRAEGSNAYPKHYRAFLDYLSTTLP